MALTEQQVLTALREVVDPEMGIDIVSLGLIYDVRIEGPRVVVQMTFTMRGCPMHDSILGAAKFVLFNLHGVEDAEVSVVWDPPWSPAMIAHGTQHGLI